MIGIILFLNHSVNVSNSVALLKDDKWNSVQYHSPYLILKQNHQNEITGISTLQLVESRLAQIGNHLLHHEQHYFKVLFTTPWLLNASQGVLNRISLSFTRVQHF